MRAPVQTAEISGYISRQVADVFQTMLSLKATFAGQIPPPLQSERVSGSVAFEGEALAGAMYLHLSPKMAARAAAAMLGMELGETPGDDEINDVVSEMTNMICGGFKSWLSDTTGTACGMSTPAITRGASFAIEPPPGMERIYLSFDCEKERVVFEIHIKFN